MCLKSLMQTVLGFPHVEELCIGLIELCVFWDFFSSLLGIPAELFRPFLNVSYLLDGGIARYVRGGTFSGPDVAEGVPID